MALPLNIGSLGPGLSFPLGFEPGVRSIFWQSLSLSLLVNQPLLLYRVCVGLPAAHACCSFVNPSVSAHLCIWVCSRRPKWTWQHWARSLETEKAVGFGATWKPSSVKCLFSETTILNCELKINPASESIAQNYLWKRHIHIFFQQTFIKIPPYARPFTRNWEFSGENTDWALHPLNASGRERQATKLIREVCVAQV